MRRLAHRRALRVLATCERCARVMLPGERFYTLILRNKPSEPFKTRIYCEECGRKMRKEEVACEED